MNIIDSYNHWLQHQEDRTRLDILEKVQHSNRVNLSQVIGVDEQKTGEYQAEIRRIKYQLRKLNRIFKNTGWRYRGTAYHK